MAGETPDWDLYRSFLAVVRFGSLSGAARELGLSQPTVGRHVHALEDALGTALFTRAPFGLAPTETALELAEHARAMAASADALVRAASGEAGEERGTVRLTASEFMGVEVLPPMLAEFRRRHPGIAIELALSNRNEDLLRRDADIAVRMARPTQEALVARRLGTVAIGLYAHRRYAEEFGLPDEPEALADHAMIGYDRDLRAVRMAGEAGFTLSREMLAFRSDNDLAQLAALRAGVGIGGCQVAVAARDPDLLPVLSGVVRFDLEIWQAMHEDLRTTRRVRLLFDHLGAALRAYAEQDRRAVEGLSAEEA